MESWIYFVLIAEFIWAFCTIIDKFVISKNHIKNPLVFIIINGLMNVLLIFIIPFVGIKALNFTGLVVLLFGSIAFNLSIILYYKAVRYEEISRITILFQVAPVFILILSFFLLGEYLTKMQLLSFALIFSAGLLVSYRKINGKMHLGKSFYIMLLSMLLSTLGILSAKYVYISTDFWNGFIWLRIGQLTALAVILIPSVRRDARLTFRKIPARIKGIIGLKMLIDFSAFIFSGIAFIAAPVALFTVFSSTIKPLLVFVLATLVSICLPHLLKEKIDKKSIIIKLAAIILIATGILILNLR